MEFDRCFQSYTMDASFSLKSVVQPKGFHSLTMYYDPYNHNILGNSSSTCPLTYDQSNNAGLIYSSGVNNARNNLGAAIGSFHNNVGFSFYDNNQQSMEQVNNQFMNGQAHANDVYPQIYSSANQMEFCSPFLPSSDFSNHVAEHSNSLFDHSVNISGDHLQVNEASANQANKRNLLKGQWTAEEDQLLVQLVNRHGVKKWSRIAQLLGFRTGKQCRDRWYNCLQPDIKKDPWSEQEDRVLVNAHSELGNKWSKIAKQLPGRTENSIKNRWYSNIRKLFPRSTNNRTYRRCPKPDASLLQTYMQCLAQFSLTHIFPEKKKRNHSRPSSSSNIIDYASHENVNIPEMYWSGAAMPSPFMTSQNKGVFDNSFIF